VLLAIFEPADNEVTESRSAWIQSFFHRLRHHADFGGILSTTQGQRHGFCGFGLLTPSKVLTGFHQGSLNSCYPIAGNLIASGFRSLQVIVQDCLGGVVLEPQQRDAFASLN
jgi:hypothetical protein